MLETIYETLWDTLKMLPFLLGVFLLMEYIHHHASGRMEKLLWRAGRYGAPVGALLGCIPQCGFSVVSANLYAGKMLSLGTLLAVFIATSDEAIPILFTNPSAIGVVMLLVAAKVVLAIVVGLGFDLFLHPAHPTGGLPPELPGCEHCGHGQHQAHGGILRPALQRTLQIFLFILLFSLTVNIIIEILGEGFLASLLIAGSAFQPALAAAIGFIPNCAASVLLAELYLSGSLSLGALFAGLCTASGVGLAVLLRTSRNLRETLKIAGILYLVSTLAGTLLQLFAG